MAFLCGVICKCVKNILTNSSSTEYRADLRLGQVDKLLCVILFAFFTALANSFGFTLLWRGIENKQFCFQKWP